LGPVDEGRLLGGKECYEWADLVDAAGAAELDVRTVVLQEPPDGVFGRDPLLFCGPLHHPAHQGGLDKGGAYRFDRRYGEIRAGLERLGTPIGDADVRIAAIALSRGLKVVTANERHFRRVPGLETENWLEE
jgi:hypothetical protein